MCNKQDVFRIENVHNYVTSIFSTLSEGNLQALKIFKFIRQTILLTTVFNVYGRKYGL